MKIRIRFAMFYTINCVSIFIEFVIICLLFNIINPQYSGLEYLFFCFGIGFIPLIYYLVLFISIYKEGELVRGASRLIRKQKRAILKQQRKKNELENSKKFREDENKLKKQNLNLQCEIRQLKRDYDKEYIICGSCGTKTSLNACFCPQCANKLK